MPGNRLQIGRAAGEWVDRDDVAITGRGLKYIIVVSSPGPPVGAGRPVKPAGFNSQIRLKTEAKIYSAVAGRIERSWISGPIVFTGLGFILGPDGLGVVRSNIGGGGLRILVELTLAMVLFTDAANADFSVVTRNLGLPGRLLSLDEPWIL